MMLGVGIAIFLGSAAIAFLGVTSSGARIRAAFGPNATARNISEMQRAMVTPPWLSGVILLSYIGVFAGVVVMVIGLI
jgi:hypothetical protein